MYVMVIFRCVCVCVSESEGTLKGFPNALQTPHSHKKRGGKKSEAVMRGWLYEGWGGDKVVRAGG